MYGLPNSEGVKIRWATILVVHPTATLTLHWSLVCYNTVIQIGNLCIFSKCSRKNTFSALHYEVSTWIIKTLEFFWLGVYNSASTWTGLQSSPSSKLYQKQIRGLFSGCACHIFDQNYFQFNICIDGAQCHFNLRSQKKNCKDMICSFVLQ